MLSMLAANAYCITGMFLYAKIMLSSIEELDNLDEICNELRVLPESLDEAYGFLKIVHVRKADEFTDMRESSQKLKTSLLLLLKGSVDLFSAGLAAHLRL